MPTIGCHANAPKERNEPEGASIPVKEIDSLISRMTLDEKLALCHASSSFTSGGVPRLDIPELTFSDGPHGVRHEHGRGWYALGDVDDRATYLPTGICLAATWNRSLGHAYGAVLGNEAKDRGKNVLLGPGVNIIRSPLNGRNFEYLSEDPFLTAQMAIGYVEGLQAQGVAACPKHYAANNQETDRHNIDAIVTQRALHEIYLPAFKAVVEDAHAWSIMGAYNKVNSQYTTHHAYLIDTVLKGEWDFDGVVISDWGSVKNTREALLFGTDIEMGTELLNDINNPDYDDFYLAHHAKTLIERGEIDESVVDEKVRRILKLMYRTTALGDHGPGRRNAPEHQQLALEVAQEGSVLLKNDGILPFDREAVQTVAVIGHNAIRKFAERGGSSQVPALYERTVLEGIQNLVGDAVEVIFAEGYQPYYDETLFRGDSNEMASQSRENKTQVTTAKSANKELEAAAIEAAQQADAVIFVGGWIHGHDGMPWGEGTYDAEARDKLNLKLLFGQEALIHKITEANPNTVVVLKGGSQVEMDGWLPTTRAYLHAWYAGMEGGTAIAQILFGDINPSGKLPITFANSHADYPSHKIGEFPGDGTVNYAEDIFVGYRYFGTEAVDVTFPFGFGLSYTKFEFTDLTVEKNGDQIAVSCRVKNTGKRKGSEVVQLYVHDSAASVDRPLRELKAFEKVDLQPDEAVTVDFTLDESAFSFFHPAKGQWVLEPGLFEIHVGNSARDIKLSADLVL